MSGACSSTAAISRGAGKVECGSCDVRVDIDAAGENNHASRVDRATACHAFDDAAVVDGNIFDDAVDVVGGVVDFAAGDAKHEDSTKKLHCRGTPTRSPIVRFRLAPTPAF
jgi:hypothetical protein